MKNKVNLEISDEIPVEAMIETSKVGVCRVDVIHDAFHMNVKYFTTKECSKSYMRHRFMLKESLHDSHTGNSQHILEMTKTRMTWPKSMNVIAEFFVQNQTTTKVSLLLSNNELRYETIDDDLCVCLWIPNATSDVSVLLVYRWTKKTKKNKQTKVKCSQKQKRSRLDSMVCY